MVEEPEVPGCYASKSASRERLTCKFSLYVYYSNHKIIYSTQIGNNQNLQLVRSIHLWILICLYFLYTSYILLLVDLWMRQLCYLVALQPHSSIMQYRQADFQLLTSTTFSGCSCIRLGPAHHLAGDNRRDSTIRNYQELALDWPLPLWPSLGQLCWLYKVLTIYILFLIYCLLKADLMNLPLSFSFNSCLTNHSFGIT